MKVLINLLSSVSGGAASYLKNSIEPLSRVFDHNRGNNSFIILAHLSQRQLFPSIPDDRCMLLSGCRPTGINRLIWERMHLPGIVRKIKADVLFIPYQIGGKIPNTKLVVMLRNMDPFTFHRYPHSIFNSIRKRIIRNRSVVSLRKADRIIAVSKYVKDYASQNLSIDNNYLKVIYHGSDAAFSPTGTVDSDKTVLAGSGIDQEFILTCGSLWPYRRGEDVIAAFAKNNMQFKGKYRLVIAGAKADRKYLEVLNRAMAASGCNKDILMLGHVPLQTMQVLYRRCALCVIASEVEACPNIAIEAMASGCVIVSSAIQPLQEIFSGCSLEYSSRDSDDLAQKMRNALENQTLQARLKSNALLRAKAFSWQRCAEETYSALVDW